MTHTFQNYSRSWYSGRAGVAQLRAMWSTKKSGFFRFFRTYLLVYFASVDFANYVIIVYCDVTFYIVFVKAQGSIPFHFTTATAVLQNDLEVFYFMKMNSFYVIVQTVYEVCHTICIKGLVILHCYSSAIYKGIYFGYDT